MRVQSEYSTCVKMETNSKNKNQTSKTSDVLLTILHAVQTVPRLCKLSVHNQDRPLNSIVERLEYDSKRSPFIKRLQKDQKS
jgi:hypothetical protein